MSDKPEIFACDVCGADDPAEIEVAAHYTGGQKLHVCKRCGLVYARERRSEQAIADSWSHDLFGEEEEEGESRKTYTALIPWVIGRLTFVAEFLRQSVGTEGREVLDIGAGEGAFLDILRRPEYGARVFGLEPSSANCARMRQMGIDCFNGTVGQFADDPRLGERRFDVATSMWTLECCRSSRQMLAGAHRALEPGGHVLIATGARILVPFKKPLHYFLSANPLDTHPVHWSFNSLRGALAVAGFEMTHVNRYIDNDLMIMIAQRREPGAEIPRQTDDWRQVIDFFDRWHRETRDHYQDV